MKSQDIEEADLKYIYIYIYINLFNIIIKIRKGIRDILSLIKKEK
jgi:hypothetical protein